MLEVKAVTTGRRKIRLKIRHRSAKLVTILPDFTLCKWNALTEQHKIDRVGLVE